MHPQLAPHPRLPAETRLWAALQSASGGAWRGCVYDVDRIVRLLEGGPPGDWRRGGFRPSWKWRRKLNGTTLLLVL